MTVTASISTKGRTATTLPLVIEAIALQTVRPKQLVIFDDNPELKDLQPDSPYCHLFPLLMAKGIQWFHFGGHRIGQVANHAEVLAHADTEFVWRCFRGRERVEAESGLKRIRDIKVGELVKTHTGSLKKVLKVYKTAYPSGKPLIFIRTKHSTIRCTPEHPFLTAFDAIPSWTAAARLSIESCLLYPDKKRTDVLSFDCAGRKGFYLGDVEIDADLARFFGLYLAEGCAGHDSIRFTVGNHESHLIEFISRLCWEKFGRTPTIHTRWATTIKLNVRSLGHKFVQWFGHEATIKRIPKFVFGWTLQNRLAFLFGYLDGDGWRHGKKGMRFGTSSEMMMQDLRKLLSECGSECSSSYERAAAEASHLGHLFKSKKSFVGTIYKDALEKMSDLLEARRFDDNYLAIPVIEVASKKMQNMRDLDQFVYNLEVEGDNSYIVGPSAVHNCDDDNVPEPDCLENLLKVMEDPAVGAVGGLVHDPKGVSPRPGFLTGKIEDIYSLNIQWYQWSGQPEEVDHLYSTFLYRVEAGRKAGGYSKLLSPVGHREETMFSHEIKRAGYKLFVTPQALTWHLREGKGGIRSYTDGSLWDRDEKVFQAKLAEWGVRARDCKFIVLNNGLGDHLMFKSILPQIMARHQGKRIILATCFPEVFLDVPGIEQASIADAIAAYGNLDQWDVYAWCEGHNWKRPFAEAMLEMYL